MPLLHGDCSNLKPLALIMALTFDDPNQPCYERGLILIGRTRVPVFQGPVLRLVTAS
jgi:hypothetical protein